MLMMVVMMREVWMEDDIPSVYGNVMDVKTVRGDYDVALKEAVRSRTPLLLKGFARHRLKWDAFEKWQDTSYMSQKLSVFEDVVDGKYNMNWDPDRDFCKDERTREKIPSCVGRGRFQIPAINMSVSRFFSDIYSNRPLMYMAPLSDEFTSAGLNDDLRDWKSIAISETEEEDSRCFLWIGGGGIISHTHYDMSHNMYVQISGRKRFLLSSPEDFSKMYLHPRGHPGNFKSQVNWEDEIPGSKRFPKWKDVDAHVAILERYDVLYLPPFWFHHVTSLGQLSVSANVWTLSNEIETYEYLLTLGFPDNFGDASKLSWMSSTSSLSCADTFSTQKTAALISFVRSLVSKMLEHYDDERSWENTIRNYLVTQRYEPLRNQLNCNACSVEYCPREEDIRSYDSIVDTYTDRVVSVLLEGTESHSSCGCKCGHAKGKCELMTMNYLEEVVSFFLGGPSNLCDFFSTCVLGSYVTDRMEL